MFRWWQCPFCRNIKHLLYSTHSLSSFNRSKSQSSCNKPHYTAIYRLVLVRGVRACACACACVVCVLFVLYNLDYSICKIIMNVCCLLLLLLLRLPLLLLLVLFLFPFFVHDASFVSFARFLLTQYSVSFFLVDSFPICFGSIFFRQFINCTNETPSNLCFLEIAQRTQISKSTSLLLLLFEWPFFLGVFSILMTQSKKIRWKKRSTVQHRRYHGFE